MRTIKTILAGSLVLALAACANNQASTQTEIVKQEVAKNVELNNTDFYEVHEDGRLYFFDDQSTYAEFLSVGETSYRQTFIGEGPDGQTLVFGMTSADKKKHYSKIAGYNLYMGNLPPADSFYGEARLEHRIYVFNRLEDMNAVRKVGEAALRFTDIGSGPKGETVVYVLNSDNKKVKPAALINEFKKRNNIL